MANDSSPSPSPLAEREYSSDRPSLSEIKTYAERIGLALWKAEDWFNEMEGCGWLDHNSRPVAKWQSILARVKTKWEADGRPSSPPASKHSSNLKTSPTQPKAAASIPEIIDYITEKFGNDERNKNWAVSFHRFWSGTDRHWARSGKPIDWKIEISQQIVKWRNERV